MFESYKEYYTKHKKNVIVSAIVVLVIIALCITLMAVELSMTELYSTSEKPEHTIGPIYSIIHGYSVSQTFVCETRALHGFALNFATYATKPDGTVTVKLTDMDTETVVFEQVTDGASIADNTFREFFFDPVRKCEGHTFKIDIYASNGDQIVSKPTTLYAAKKNVYEGELTVNGQARDYDLNLRIYANKTFGFNNVLILTVCISAIIFIAYTHYDQYKHDKETLAEEPTEAPENQTNS